MVWYSHLFKNAPLVVIHTVKAFGVVNKAEVDVFLEFSCFFHDRTDVGNLISGSSAFSTLPHVVPAPSLFSASFAPISSVWSLS